MKWKLFFVGFLTAVALCLLAVSITSAAQPPAEYHYGMVQCSGLSLAELAIANQKFDSAYGWQHNLTTPAEWSGSYEARVEMFASTLGCPRVFRDGQLTLHYKLYGFWYKFYLEDGVAPVALSKLINQ